MFIRMMAGLAAAGAEPKTVMIDEMYLKAHRTPSSLQIKKDLNRCPTGPRPLPQATWSSWTTCPAISVNVRDLIEAAGARLLLLPPYSPDFSPIEKAFSRLKAMLRKAGERPVSGLWSLIGRLVDLFRPQGCANCFSSLRL